jgi:hypothetical protein
MSIDDIKQTLVTDFKPCRIASSSRHEYVVTHPDCVLIGAYSIAILDKDGCLVTRSHDHVASIKDEPLKKSGSKR